MGGAGGRLEVNSRGLREENAVFDIWRAARLHRGVEAQ